MPGPYGVAERETRAYRKVRRRDESLPDNKRGEVSLSSTYYMDIAYFL